jgi:hypothetical protein
MSVETIATIWSLSLFVVLLIGYMLGFVQGKRYGRERGQQETWDAMTILDQATREHWAEGESNE